MAATYTLRDIITASLRLISATDPNQTLDGQSVQDALYTAIEILDSWNVDGGMIYSQTIGTFPVLEQKQTYTIGPDLSPAFPVPDFIVPARPQNLIYAAFQPTGVSPVIELPLKIINSVEWAQIVSKNVGSGIPTQIYLDQTFPIGNLNVWNEPNQGGNFVLQYWNQLPSFDMTLDTVFTTKFPPGYMRLLRYEIAMNIAPEYGKSMPPDVASVLSEIKRNINNNNITSEWSTYDVPVGSGAYDARSGTSWK